MMRDIIWLGTIAVLLPASALATDPPDIEWQRTFRGIGIAEGYWVEPATDGGFVASGYTYSPDTSRGRLFYLVKVDSSGMLEWEHSYIDGKDGVARCVQATSDAGYVLIGGVRDIADSSDPISTKVTLVKTDSMGDVQWTRSYSFGDPGITEDGMCVRQVEDGGFVFTVGRRFNSDSALCVSKVDADGNVLWSRNLPAAWSRNAECLPLVTTSGGGFAVGSRTIWGLDSLGVASWLWTYPGVADARSIRQLGDSGFVATGFVFYGTASDADSVGTYLLRTNKAGTLLWCRDIAGFASLGGYSVAEVSDGYVVAGCRQHGYVHTNLGLMKALGGDEAIAIKTDASGIRQWVKALGLQSCARGIASTPDGGLALVGFIANLEDGLGLSIWKLAPEAE